jgi:hypothetical protein
MLKAQSVKLKAILLKCVYYSGPAPVSQQAKLIMTACISGIILPFIHPEKDKSINSLILN